MCKTIESANQLLELVNSFDTRKKLLEKRLSELDKCQVDLLHMIESEDSLNVVRGYDLCKAIKDIRVERRQVKNELQILDVFVPKIVPIKNNLLITVNKAKEMETKSNYISRNKFYKPRQINIKADIRLEVRKLIEGVN